ncbi:MAG: DUF5615 family PIN-like protein [Candidatus Omnitrophica bacterium]|nr:DUF5615 family PIN-like protein [Candidatus Omnitrophota bacterium]MCB9747563.1 DUF5615 family PIN-like protein [Candidatus Omnitrophota bacterium]
MIIWIDAQLSPHLAEWIKETFHIDAYSVRDLGLRDAEDRTIFKSAKLKKAAIMTKDNDFLTLLDELGGPPPQIIWITCGNTSNNALKKILSKTLPTVLTLLKDGESIVEIRDQS